VGNTDVPRIPTSRRLITQTSGSLLAYSHVAPRIKATRHVASRIVKRRLMNCRSLEAERTT
jgi:hypothetical protein